MASRTVVIKGKNVGLDVNRIAIYRDEIHPDKLVSIVTKAAFMSGYEFQDDEMQDKYVCQCDDPCNTVVNLFLRERNFPPVVTITGPTSAYLGSTITLTATATDANGDTVTFEWEDGTQGATNNVTSSNLGDVTYNAVGFDEVGDWDTDSHVVNWYTTTTTTTTTTQPPGPTTTSTTTQTPCTDCAGDIDSISDFSASVGGASGTISITGTNISPSSVYTWDPNLVNVSLSGSTLSWSTNSNNLCGTAHIRVFANNTLGGNCCNEAEDFYITVTGCVGTTTTTTTTQAPVTTTTTTTQAPVTTTTTTQAPGYWNLRLCDTGSLANQQVQDTGNINTGDVFKAGNGICYEVDTFQSNQSGGLQIIVSEFGDCQECLDANGGV